MFRPAKTSPNVSLKPLDVPGRGMIPLPLSSSALSTKPGDVFTFRNEEKDLISLLVSLSLSLSHTHTHTHTHTHAVPGVSDGEAKEHGPQVAVHSLRWALQPLVRGLGTSEYTELNPLSTQRTRSPSPSPTTQQGSSQGRKSEGRPYLCCPPRGLLRPPEA